MIREFELLRANVPDSQGDTFTQECLERIVKDFSEGDRPLLVTKDFSGRLEDTQGVVQELRMDGSTLMAKVQLLDVGAGKPIIEIFSIEGVGKQLELAAGGTVYEQLLPEPIVLGNLEVSEVVNAPRTILSMKLDRASITDCKVK